ncbi:MAG: hypothetical protein GYB66_09380 [Chloroflexi bacterium]|nr:hypothetical protein [Chloroflexota bacterium]
MGNDFPDFASMSEEEQMRWLESLAARQGAKNEEFVTSADMQVNEVDPDTADMSHVGPGYTPSETFSFSSHPEAPPEEPVSEAKPAPPEVPPVEPAPEMAAPTPSADDLATSDPMAFLEALAARQGANPEEFTTAADMQVPEIDESTADMSHVGPGYTPSETFSFSRQEPAVEAPQLQSEPPAEPPAAPATPEPTGAPSLEDLASSDPMAFLEALAARQGANPEEFTTAADMQVPELDESTADMSHVGPGYTPSETFSFSRHETPATSPSDFVAEPPPEPLDELEGDLFAEASTSEALPDLGPVLAPDNLQPAASEKDPEEGYATEPLETVPAEELVDPELSSEADPMKWLESLAARQGANPEEFMTPADMAVDEVDPDSADMSHVGPGYEPYSPFETTPGSQAEQYVPPPEPPMAPEPVVDDLEPEDPMAWLEELAADQGPATTDFLEELSPGQPIPELDLDFQPSDIESGPVLVSEEPSEDQHQGVSDDFLMSATDEEVARMQAEGTITPEQELAWLTHKANRMGEILEEDELEAPVGIDDEAEALPADMPDWLKAQMPEDLSALPEESDEDQYTDLVDHLVQEPDDLEIDELFAQATAADLDTVAAGPPEDVAAVPPEGARLLEGYDPSFDHWAEALDAEYEGKLHDKVAKEEPDWYAEALAQAKSMEPEPPAAPEPDIAEPEPEPPAETPSEVPAWLLEEVETDTGFVTAAEDDDSLPEWLRMGVGGDESAMDISDWLREQQLGGEEEPWMPAETELDTASVDAWLEDVTVAEVPAEAEPAPLPQAPKPQPAPPPPVQEPVAQPVASVAPSPAEETLPQGVDGELPPWYTGGKPVSTYAKPSMQTSAAEPRPQAPKPAPAPVAPARAPRAPVTEQPVPQPAAQSILPDDPAFAQFRSTLEQNPEDHTTRLKLARELNTKGQMNASLEQYETLIEYSAQLDDLATDLVAMVDRLPQHPRVRRLLGDTYMRQGRLQEALDTYRGALNQL